MTMVHLETLIHKVLKGFEVWSVRLYGNGRKSEREERERSTKKREVFGCVCMVLTLTPHQNHQLTTIQNI